MVAVEKDGERRQHNRYRAHFAVTMESEQKKGRVGVARDASVSGILVNTRSHFSAGDALELTLHLPPEPAVGHRVRAHVVRVSPVEMTSDLPFKWLTAARFEDEVPTLEPALRAKSVPPPPMPKHEA